MYEQSQYLQQASIVCVAKRPLLDLDHQGLDAGRMEAELAVEQGERHLPCSDKSEEECQKDRETERRKTGLLLERAKVDGNETPRVMMRRKSSDEKSNSNDEKRKSSDEKRKSSDEKK